MTKTPAVTALVHVLRGHVAFTDKSVHDDTFKLLEALDEDLAEQGYESSSHVDQLTTALEASINQADEDEEKQEAEEKKE